MLEYPQRQRANSVSGAIRDTTARAIDGAREALKLEDSKSLKIDADSSPAEFKEWIRKVPHQLQELVDVLARPQSGSSGSRNQIQGQFVPRAAQYIATDSLIHGVVYFARYLASKSTHEQAELLQPQALMLTFATSMVLADKFANDDAYDDLLPAVGIVTGIQPKTLRRKEVELLGFLINTSGMFVSESEFESIVYLLEESPWRRLKRDGTLSLLCKTAREHTGVADLHEQLFTANVRVKNTGLTKSLKVFSDYVRTNRPRLGSFAERKEALRPNSGPAHSRQAGALERSHTFDENAAPWPSRNSSAQPAEPPGSHADSSFSNGRGAEVGGSFKGSATGGGGSHQQGRRMSLPQLGGRGKQSTGSAPASPAPMRRSFFGLLARPAKSRSSSKEQPEVSPRALGHLSPSPPKLSASAGSSTGATPTKRSVPLTSPTGLASNFAGIMAPAARAAEEEPAPLPTLSEEKEEGHVGQQTVDQKLNQAIAQTRPVKAKSETTSRRASAPTSKVNSAGGSPRKPTAAVT